MRSGEWVTSPRVIGQQSFQSFVYMCIHWYNHMQPGNCEKHLVRNRSPKSHLRGIPETLVLAVGYMRDVKRLN